MTDIYDVAVVGAGPAGSVFARELLRKRPGLRIAVIDGQSEEKSKPCGGLLAPDAQKVLAQFDMTLPTEILADPQIFSVETIDLVSGKVRYYQRHYLNMNRYAFDRWLVSLIPESAELMRGRCVGISRTDVGFELNLGGSLLTARALVGADGASSIVRRTFFKPMGKQYVSIQQWFENKGQKLPYYSCIFDSKTSDSCSWTIHKDGMVVFGGAFRKQGCREAFELQKKRFESFTKNRLGEPLKTEACLVSSPRRMSDFKCAIPGVYLVGEAAGFISSSSFEGISSALISAKKLADAFSSGEDCKSIARIYKKNTRGLRFKLWTKTAKRFVLCSQSLRWLIMKSGIESIKKEK